MKLIFLGRSLRWKLLLQCSCSRIRECPYLRLHHHHRLSSDFSKRFAKNDPGIQEQKCFLYKIVKHRNHDWNNDLSVTRNRHVQAICGRSEVASEGISGENIKTIRSMENGDKQ